MTTEPATAAADERQQQTPETIEFREFVRWAYEAVLRRPCNVEEIEQVTQALDPTPAGKLSLVEGLLRSDEYLGHFAYRSRSAFPEGHFYSPMPSDDDIAAYGRQQPSAPPDYPGINLDLPRQRKLLTLLARLYPTIPFTEERHPHHRYCYQNETFAYADAIFFHGLIRLLRPKRIIEVGSGNSSCVALDTNDLYFDGAIDCTFIEPYPAFLKSLLRADDRIHLLSSKLQDVDLDIFRQLRRRDILFIDSTHVSKLGSDVNRIFFEILPALERGVFIHIHDVFGAFEYPMQWLEEGRGWNEQYLLRAFLQYNEHFRIRLFPGVMIPQNQSWFEQHMPLVLKNPGGSIWLEKVK